MYLDNDTCSSVKKAHFEMYIHAINMYIYMYMYIHVCSIKLTLELPNPTITTPH